MKRIIVTIDKHTGKIVVEADGYKGSVCEKEIEKIFPELKKEKIIKKPEYREKVRITSEGGIE